MALKQKIITRSGVPATYIKIRGASLHPTGMCEVIVDQWYTDKERIAEAQQLDTKTYFFEADQETAAFLYKKLKEHADFQGAVDILVDDWKNKKVEKENIETKK